MKSIKTYDDILKLFGLSEDGQLDVKGYDALPLSRYKNDDYKEQKIEEAVEDITAFANADGGYIIYGLKTKGRPEKITEFDAFPTGETNPVKTLQDNLNNYFLKLPDPFLDYEIYPVHLLDQKYVVVIRVQPSFVGTIQAKDGNYWIRQNDSKVKMNRQLRMQVDARSQQPRFALTVRIPQVNPDHPDIVFEAKNVGRKTSTQRTYEFHVPRNFRPQTRTASNNNYEHDVKDGLQRVWVKSTERILIEASETATLSLNFMGIADRQNEVLNQKFRWEIYHDDSNPVSGRFWFTQDSPSCLNVHIEQD